MITLQIRAFVRQRFWKIFSAARNQEHSRGVSRRLIIGFATRRNARKDGIYVVLFLQSDTNSDPFRVASKTPWNRARRERVLTWLASVLCCVSSRDEVAELASLRAACVRKAQKRWKKKEKETGEKSRRRAEGEGQVRLNRHTTLERPLAVFVLADDLRASSRFVLFALCIVLQ